MASPRHDKFPERPIFSRYGIWSSRIVLNAGKPILEHDMPTSSDGAYHRNVTSFRHSIEPSDPIVASVNNGSKRLCLVACNGCPWAHRTIICRNLLGLEGHVSLVPTDDWNPFPSLLKMPLYVPAISTQGWRLNKKSIPPHMIESLSDSLRARLDETGYLWLWELYVHSKPTTTGRVNVPVVWDCETKTIINNESAEVIRIFNKGLRSLCSNKKINLCPPEVDISTLNMLGDLIYNINNGVYRTGFAEKKGPREQAKADVYGALDKLETLLAARSFLLGDSLTESDIRLYVSLIRYEFGYYFAFRVDDKHMLRYSYPNVFEYMQRLYSIPAIKDVSYPALYPLFYLIIMRSGRQKGGLSGLKYNIANLVRASQIFVFTIMRTTAPDAPLWRFKLAEFISLPLAALSWFLSES